LGGLGREIGDLKRGADERSRQICEMSRAIGELAQGQALIQQGMGIKADQQPDGSTKVRSKLLKLDRKGALTLVGAVGGLVILYQIAFPTLLAALSAFHAAVMGR